MFLRAFALALLSLSLAACGDNIELVIIERLAPGDGERGDGREFTSSRPTLDVLVRIESDATDFNPGDIMRVEINGTDRTADLVMGGNYALIRLDPPPLGAPQFITLGQRVGPVRDTVTITATAYLGPTLASVAPNQAQAGSAVTILGTGFDAGVVRVFFGGVEGTVTASDATSITATIPDDALTGLVWVLIGNDAAEGIVGFQLLDDADEPVPLAAFMQLHAVFPANGSIDTPVTIYGTAIDDFVTPRFVNFEASRVFAEETITVEPIGDIVRAVGVVNIGTRDGAGEVRLERGFVSNTLPFVVATPVAAE